MLFHLSSTVIADNILWDFFPHCISVCHSVVDSGCNRGRQWPGIQAGILRVRFFFLFVAALSYSFSCMDQVIGLSCNKRRVVRCCVTTGSAQQLSIATIQGTSKTKSPLVFPVADLRFLGLEAEYTWFWLILWKQECTPVGCVPPACA